MRDKCIKGDFEMLIEELGLSDILNLGLHKLIVFYVQTQGDY